MTDAGGWTSAGGGESRSLLRGNGIGRHVARWRQAARRSDSGRPVDVSLGPLAGCKVGKSGVTDACNAERVGDIDSSAVAAAVASLQADGLSLRTCNGYPRAVKTFSRWLWRDGRTIQDTLAT